ncbi:MAG: molybdopterin-dependent oxidoreductase [Gordonibacter sp.]|uniref:molybdopterin-dependent oxidoreductase n=1 Tax=Gordonibacter sp. TaxID=1968902 RepID=UPI002FC5ABBC
MAMDKGWKEVAKDGSYIVRTCGWSPPGDHPVGCGMKLTIKDGKLVHVEGDEQHPVTQGRLCIRCLDLPEVVHSPERIIHPMKRDPKDRGKDKWEQISLDEAYHLIADRVAEIKQDFGAESIVVYGGTGREASLYYYPLGFATLGTPNVCYPHSGFSCYGPRCSITDYILGAGYPEIDFAGYFEDRYNNPEFELPEWIVCWGKMPLASNGDGMFGHAILDMMKMGTRVIMIDPRITWLGAFEGNMTLQLKPNTDAALGLGLINVIIQEDLYDHDFVENWCFGFDELAERAAEFPPERVEELTWVRADDLKEVARTIGKARPVSFAWGLPVDQNPNGVQAGHTIIALAALTGMIDVPGGLTLGPPHGLFGSWRFSTRFQISDELYAKRIGANDYPAVSNAMSSTHPDLTLDTLETGEPYELHMAWFNSVNILSPTCCAQPERWYKALLKMDFNVIQDLFMTPTAMALADVFLPLSTFAEHDGLVLTHYGRNPAFMGAMNKALQIGECRSDIEHCMELGKIINPDGWPFEDAADFFNQQVGEEFDFDFDGLRDMCLYQPEYTYRKYEKGMLRADGEPGFDTVTGKVELYSTLFDAWGEDPLPYYEQPRWDQISRPEDAEEFPLLMTTGAREYTSFHSEHRQIPMMREIKRYPDIEINPATAAQFGIEDGDWVRVENQLGSAIEKAHLVETIDPRVVHCRHGWWYPEQEGEAPNLYGVFKSNINSLIPHKEIGKLGFGAPFKCVMCKITKVDGLDG